MSLFASRRNTLTEQRVIGRELEALLDAVEVTGLNAWERAKKLHGGLAEGAVVGPVKGKGRSVLDGALPASSVQQLLFEGEAP